MNLGDGATRSISIEFEPPLPTPVSDFETRLLTLTVEEGAREPGRFEIEIADPQCEFWDLEPPVVGRMVTIHLGSGPPFRGVVVGKRLQRDPTAGTVSTLWGLDFGVRMMDGPHFRAFSETSIEGVVRSLCTQTHLESHIAGLPEVRIRESGTIVQYNESELGFLRRQGSAIGAEVWFWRGGLYFGVGPGAGCTVDRDISQHGSDIGTVFLDEDWADEPAGFSIPLHGTPFTESPRLPRFSKAEPIPKTRVLPEIQSRSPSERRVFGSLRSSASIDWPAGIAASAEQQSSTATTLAASRRDQRIGGALHWRGPLPPGATPGCRVRLKWAERGVVCETIMFGLKQVYSGRQGQLDCVAELGRLGPIREAPPDIRPAHHLWPARVVGGYNSEGGTIVVAPIGWHADSRLRTRILSAFAGTELAVVSVPRVGELGLLGFEGGQPDSPVWLGSLHDSRAPDQATPEGAVRGAARFSGGGSAIWSAEPGDAARKLRIELKGLDLEIQSDSMICLNANKSVGISTDLFEVQNAKNVKFTTEQMMIKSSNVKVSDK